MKTAGVLPVRKVPSTAIGSRARRYSLCLLLLAALLPPEPISAQENPSEAGGERQGSKLPEKGSSDAFAGKTLVSEAMAYEMMRVRQENAPRVGEPAPPFRLYSLDRKREVELKELIRDKRVVLLFASWGCDVFRESVGGLNLLYLQFREKVDFVLIYTREVHPLDGFGAALARVRDPKTDAERRNAASQCRQQLRLPFEVLVDGIDDSVATRWAGIPVRAFVIDRSGTVIYAGAQGPWGFRPYEGFQHGDGSRLESDLEYNWDTLESFLNKRYGP